MKKIIECVPNFSEGQRPEVIELIATAIKSVDGVKLLHVDPGEAANRTVMTFAGEPQAVCEAAFRAVDKAAQLIDMRQQHGRHPRIGATDVLPLIPVSGISLEECAVLARQLAQRVAGELHIPCYSYEAAALKDSHRNLADCRRGEYEGLAARMSDPEERPDWGARPFDEQMARTGCSVIGARNFLIAVNFNLNTTDTAVAKAIAADVREKGTPGRPHALQATKAIGWFIDEYGIAQVSMNITDISKAPLHRCFEEVSRCAGEHGVSVTGTEIIGLVPKQVLTAAGRFYLGIDDRPSDEPESTLIDAAVHAMNLGDLRPFSPKEKILEYLL